MSSEATLKMLLLGEDRSASRSIKNVGDAADKSGGKVRRFSGLWAGLAGAAATGVAGIAVAGGALGALGLKTAAANEQAEISFTTMLGGARKAKAFLEDLQAFAAKTPFEFPELQTAASSLISAGIEAKKVIPIMTTLGDVTSGMGTGSEGVRRATIALQQMSAAGRITGEDLNQLRDAGIPVYDLLAKATGKSKEEVVKLAQAGKLGKQELGQMMQALESGKGLERFTGLMEKQSASLTGMWATFKDTLGQNMAAAVQPLIPLIKDGLGGASTFLGEKLPIATAALGDFVKGMRDGTGPGGRAADVLGLVGDAAKAAGHWIGDDLVPFVKDLVERFGDAVGGSEGFRDILADLEPTGRLVVGVLKGLWNMLDSGSNGSIPVVVGSLQAMITIIGALSRAAIWLWNNAFGPSLKSIARGIAILMGTWAALLNALGHVPGFGWAKDAAKEMSAAAREADDLASSIRDIPPKKTVSVTYRERFITDSRGNKHNTSPGNHGIGISARGQRDWRGGLTWVGEEGRELVELPTGSRIHDAATSDRMTGDSGDLGTATILVKSDDGTLIEKKLAKLKRTRGGLKLEFETAS